MAMLESNDSALFMGGRHTAGVFARLDLRTWAWTHLPRPPSIPAAPVCGVMKNLNASTGEEEEFFVMGNSDQTDIFSMKVVFHKPIKYRLNVLIFGNAELLHHFRMHLGTNMFILFSLE